jgi:hypothetical protein
MNLTILGLILYTRGMYRFTISLCRVKFVISIMEITIYIYILYIYIYIFASLLIFSVDTVQIQCRENVMTTLILSMRFYMLTDTNAQIKFMLKYSFIKPKYTTVILLGYCHIPVLYIQTN